ncbi:MAG: PhoH family protein, partial [Candidatus Omnitrophota bacterium]
MEKQIKLKNSSEALMFLGPRDENIPVLEKELEVTILLRSDTMKISGSKEKLKKALVLIERVLSAIRLGQTITKQELQRMFFSGKEKASEKKEEKLDIGFSFKGKTVGPKTAIQNEYIRAIKQHDIVFGVGPAGTGKTYLAMAMAVEALRKGYFRRIILTRPAVEAGESLGYLPGTLYEKILPFLRPLYDALYDMMEGEQIEKYIEIGTIEVAPLAYMRGRTLND